MSGKDKEFYDEIIDSLRACEEESAAAYVAKDILLEFYKPVPKQKAGPRPVPVKQGVAGRENPVPPAVQKRTENPPHFRQTVPTTFRQENPPVIPQSPPVQPVAEMKKEPLADMGKQVQEMDFPELKEAVSICTKCLLCRTRTNTVFGDGNEKAELMFIGEGPGADEDAQGLPFVGRAGELLTKMIQAMGYDRKEVYIGNIVKCRPPGNRTPEEEEMTACLPYILRQIELIRPKAVVLLGATALKGLFNMTGISYARGKFLDYKGIPVMPTYHPAFLLRNLEKKADVWKDLQMVMKLLGKEVPKKRNQ